MSNNIGNSGKETTMKIYVYGTIYSMRKLPERDRLMGFKKKIEEYYLDILDEFLLKLVQVKSNLME